MDDVRPCRVVGLTSAKGQRLNGTAGQAPHRSSSERIPVLVEGQPGPLSLKRTNVEFLPRHLLDGGVGVGRVTIRDAEFQVAAVDCEFNQRVGPNQILRGEAAGAARCRGNLMAARTLLEAFPGSGREGVVIMCTDLNVSRAVDIAAAAAAGTGGAEAVALAPAFQKEFQVVQKLVEREVKRGSFVMANYRPHRLQPDEIAKDTWRGAERYRAAKDGAYKIYPCTHKQNWDAMEVRYVDTSTNAPECGSDGPIIRHEHYLDYGPNEAELYVENAAALGETERLQPETLAKVDPQAFWAALHHAQVFLNAIDNLDDANLLGLWKQMTSGARKSQEKWSKVAEGVGIKLPTAVVTGDNLFSWPIETDADHEKIASGCANIALLMMLECLDDEKDLQVKAASTVDVLDICRGSDLSSLASALSSAKRREAQHLAKGKELEPLDRASFMKLALEEAGYGNGTYLETDPLDRCYNCNKAVTDMKMCSKCNGVAYCGTECARASWKLRHKKECRVAFAHLRRSVLYLAKKHNITIDPRATGGSNAPTESCMFSEASGTGSVAIMWNPDPSQPSFVTLTDTSSMASGSGDASSNERNAMSPVASNGSGVPDFIAFRSMSELEPPLRFLLACGPLADIDVARGCVDEVISLVRGDLRSLKMQVVGFSPLDWAAKKGNADIVDWLCTDERTKCLINEGCPVGWACYTGNVDIARKLVGYGVDATKTSPVLFYSCPPLLLSGENGKLESMKFLVDELGHDITMVGPTGRNILDSITCPPNWREIEGHRKAYDWAKARLR